MEGKRQERGEKSVCEAVTIMQARFEERKPGLPVTHCWYPESGPPRKQGQDRPGVPFSHPHRSKSAHTGAMILLHNRHHSPLPAPLPPPPFLPLSLSSCFFSLLLLLFLFCLLLPSPLSLLLPPSSSISPSLSHSLSGTL